jgi:hypothetical protein
MLPPVAARQQGDCFLTRRLVLGLYVWPQHLALVVRERNGEVAMSAENRAEIPKPNRMLLALQRLLELSATDSATILHQTAQIVAEALSAQKVDVLLYDPRRASSRMAPA